jgi:oxygen-dependent protoporphyrinogen oxidase
MPQYCLGHSEKLAALEGAMKGLPGVFLTGSAYRGVGLADCVKQAASTAADVTTFLA